MRKARQDQTLQNSAHFGIVECRGHWQVKAISNARVSDRPSERPTLFFVDGNHHNIRIPRKGVLHPIRMMRVNIDIGDPLHTRMAQG